MPSSRRAVRRWSMGALVLLSIFGACQAPKFRARYMTDHERETLPSLRVGDQAPELALDDWVQGERVTDFAAGRVRVIEFWSTGCGPCIAAMPQISALQERFGDDVVVISIGIKDNVDASKWVRTIVEQQRENLRVRVAFDGDGAGVERYQIASRSSSIPRAFLLDRAGRLVWIGHPNDLDEPIEAVLAGTWDVDSAASEFMRSAEIARSTRVLVRKYLDAWRRDDDAGRLAAAEAYCAYPLKDADGYAPEYFAWPARIELLVKAGRVEDAERVAREAMNVPGVSDSQGALAEMARLIVHASPHTAMALSEQSLRVMRTAETEAKVKADASPTLAHLVAAQRSYNSWFFAELATVMSAAGRRSEAAALQREAIERWPYEDSAAPGITAMRKTLAEYEGAAAG